MHACAERRENVAAIFPSRNNGDLGVGKAVPQRRQRFDARHARHTQIHQDQIARALIREHFKGLIQGFGFAHFVRLQHIDQQLLQAATKQLVIISNERPNRHSHHSEFVCGLRRGRAETLVRRIPATLNNELASGSCRVASGTRASACHGRGGGDLLHFILASLAQRVDPLTF